MRLVSEYFVFDQEILRRVTLFARVQSLQALQTHHFGLQCQGFHRCLSPLTVCSSIYKKHIQVYNKMHFIKLKMTNRWQLPNKQNCGPHHRHDIHPTYTVSASVMGRLQNTEQENVFHITHSLCLCSCKYLCIYITPHQRLFSMSTYTCYTLRGQEKYLSVQFSVWLGD